MNPYTLAEYPTHQAALDAGENPKDLVIIEGEPEAVRAAMDAIRRGAPIDRDKKRAKRKAQKAARKRNR